jgi:GxxExxY protein
MFLLFPVASAFATSGAKNVLRSPTAPVTCVVLSDEELTYRTIGCYRWVYNTMGYGLLESGYVGAFVRACVVRGLSVEREVHAPLYFEGVVVANYRLDLVIEGRLIVEIKACQALRSEHVKQVLHYLRCTDYELALLFNFGLEPELKRYTLRNSLKNRPRKN